MKHHLINLRATFDYPSDGVPKLGKVEDQRRFSTPPNGSNHLPL